MLDKGLLRLAKDTLQLYHAIVGKGKFHLANKLLLIGITVEGCSYMIMSIMCAISELYFFSGFIMLGAIFAFLVFKLGKKENAETEILEKRAKESGSMIPPEYYNAIYLVGARVACWGGIFFVALPPYSISSLLWGGIFIRGFSYYVVMTEDLPPGKSIFEKVKDKIKSIDLVPATLKPVKVNGR